MAKNLNIQTPVVDSYGNPVLNIEEDSSLSIDTSTVENYASPVLVVDDATADYVAYIEFGGSGDITNYYTKAEVDGYIESLSEQIEDKASKADASAFINVGEQPSLADAIRAIKYRRGLQVVTFKDSSTLRHKHVSLWIPNLMMYDIVDFIINNESIEIVAKGSTEKECNESIYNGIVNNQYVQSLLKAKYFVATYNTMIFEFKEEAEDPKINATLNKTTPINIKILQSYKCKENKSYQYKLIDTDNNSFLDTYNWEVYVEKGIWNNW